MVRRLMALCLLSLVLLHLGAGTALAQVKKKYWETPPPSAIRVAIRESAPWGEPDPRGRILYVRDMSFDYYIRNVLPHEWIPSWNKEALKAGAMAIKMFAWYHILNPKKIDGFSFDVDNSTNFQVFRETLRTAETDAAFDDIAGMAYVERDGSIFELQYRAGKRNDPNYQYRNADKMSQWGSQYWAERGKTYLQILQFYYEGRTLVRYRG